MKNKRIKDKNKKQEGPIVIELNLSLTIGVIGAIIAIIVAITTVKVITTMIQANENKNAANESDINQHAIYVTSTTKDESGNIVEDKDSEGNVIKVPVPKGYTASQIDGETSANKGFVIYEGDVDWSAILVNDKSTKSAGTQSINNTESTQSTTASTESVNTQPTVKNTENSITQATITSSTENELTSDEGANDEEKINSVSANDENSNKITSTTKKTKDKNENQITETTKENNNTIKTTKNEENNNVTETTQQSEKGSTIKSQSTEKVENEQKKITISTEKTNNKINDKNTTEEMINIVDLEADTTTNDTGTTGSTELTLEEQQNKNIFDLQKERNQYVWVPVSNISEIYGVDSNKKIWGKLYNFSSSGRSNRNWTETNGIMSITNATNFREPDVVWSTGSYVYDTDGFSYMHSYGLGQTRYEMLAQELEQNYLEIMESIKKYGGFYIGRYETGGLNGTAVVRKMDTNIASQNWYTMYKKCLTLKGSNDNIKTMMITGSLWDETLEWLVKSGATNSAGTTLTYQLVVNNSPRFGNYNNATFSYIAKDAEQPVETETKETSKGVLIPTGSAEYTKTNNIYDMAGNVWEWTTEADSTGNRVHRGGGSDYNGYSYPMAYRGNFPPGIYTSGIRVQELTLHKIGYPETLYPDTAPRRVTN